MHEYGDWLKRRGLVEGKRLDHAGTRGDANDDIVVIAVIPEPGDPARVRGSGVGERRQQGQRAGEEHAYHRVRPVHLGLSPSTSRRPYANDIRGLISRATRRILRRLQGRDRVLQEPTTVNFCPLRRVREDVWSVAPA